MEHRRYGKLRLGDYKFTLAGIGGMVLLAVACFVLDCGLCYSVYLISFAAVWVALIVWPYLERFTVEDHLIVSRRFRHVSEIVLPPDSVLVFTQADIRDTFSVQSYFLKGKYPESLTDQFDIKTLKCDVDVLIDLDY